MNHGTVPECLLECHLMPLQDRTCPNLPQLTLIGLNLSQLVSTCHDLTRLATLCCDLPRLSQTCSTCLNSPHLASSCLILPQLTSNDLNMAKLASASSTCFNWPPLTQIASTCLTPTQLNACATFRMTCTMHAYTRQTSCLPPHAFICPQVIVEVFCSLTRCHCVQYDVHFSR